jgi:hypothetical protein
MVGSTKVWTESHAQTPKELHATLCRVEGGETDKVRAQAQVKETQKEKQIRLITTLARGPLTPSITTVASLLLRSYTSLKEPLLISPLFP